MQHLSTTTINIPPGVVLLSLEEYKKLKSAAEMLSDIEAYDEAKKESDGSYYSWEDAKKMLNEPTSDKE